ncbi:MAG: PKD-like domain-containing protein, partial [Bacteroidota bacterium]
MDLKYPILTLFSLILMGQLVAQELSITSQKPVLSSSAIVSSGNTIEAATSSSIGQMTTCLIDGAIEMTNLVTNLPTDLTNCYVGDSIEICFQVNQYEQINNNWLQAIVPSFGECFYIERDPITQEPLRYTVPPPASANGQWQWFPDLSVLYNDIPNGSLAGGDPVGEGWFFVGEIPSGAPCFDPTDPNCTWGDQIAGANGGTFEICIIVELTCSDPSPDFLPCDVDFKTYSDGEVGAYQFPACQNDGLIQDLLFFACCEDPEIINDSYELSVCSGESANILIVSDMDPETTYEWVATPEAFGATSGSGALIDDVYFNDTGSPVTVEYLVTPTCALGCVGREKLFTVTIWPEVEANIDGSGTICEGDCAFLSAETGSDQAPFTYEWSTGSTDQGFVACEAAGFYFYSVTITDRNGCQDESIFWLEVLPIPDVSIDVVGPTILCPGESTQLVASASGSFGSYTFNWDGGQVGNTLTVDQPGTYTVMATDLFGCSSFPASVTIEGVNIDLSVVSSGPELVCAQGGGNIVDLVASASGGSGNYIYQWSNGGGSESIAVDQPGSYAVAVTDVLHGCFADAVIEVEGAEPPTLSIDAGPDSEICADGPTDGITLNATIAGGSGDFSYNWTDGTEAASTFVQQSESIGLSIVDQQTGCLVTAAPVDLTIHPPISVSIIPDAGTELCATNPDDGLTFFGLPAGGSGSYAYSWTTGDFSETAFVQSTGSIGLTIVDEQSGCIAESEPLEITIHDPLEVSFATDAGLELCAAAPGDGISVSAIPGGGSGDYQFNWANGESGAEVLLQSSGSVDLTVIDQQTGCSTSAESPLVTIHPPLELTILADAPTALCENSDEWPVQLSATAISGSGDYAFS